MGKPCASQLRDELHGAGEHAKRMIDHIITAACLLLEDYQARERTRAGDVEIVTSIAPAQNADGLMTLQEAAKFLHVSEPTVPHGGNEGLFKAYSTAKNGALCAMN